MSACWPVTAPKFTWQLHTLHAFLTQGCAGGLDAASGSDTDQDTDLDDDGLLIQKVLHVHSVLIILHGHLSCAAWIELLTGHPGYRNRLLRSPNQVPLLANALRPLRQLPPTRRNAQGQPVQVWPHRTLFAVSCAAVLCRVAMSHIGWDWPPKNMFDGPTDIMNGDPPAPRAAGGYVTLKKLLDAGLLQPGTDNLWCEYKGVRSVGSLTPEGRISWEGVPPLRAV